MTTARIIDSIKRVSAQTSSVREVLPGRPYFIAQTQEKLDPLSTTEDAFCQSVFSKPMKLAKAIYSSYTGISRSLQRNCATVLLWNPTRVQIRSRKWLGCISIICSTL